MWSFTIKLRICITKGRLVEELSAISSGNDAPSLISEGDMKVSDNHVPVTPPTSESSDENNDEKIPNATEASFSDNNQTLIGYDDGGGG